MLAEYCCLWPRLLFTDYLAKLPTYLDEESLNQQLMRNVAEGKPAHPPHRVSYIKAPLNLETLTNRNIYERQITARLLKLLLTC
jgi:hypothetical protein